MKELYYLWKRLGNLKRILIISGCLLITLVLLFSLWQSADGVSRTASAAKLDLLKEGWNYMPGVKPESDGLRVSYVGKAIVKQDGSSGMANPPVNTYGTHLSATNDFTLTATMKDIKGDVSLRLYAGVPIIQDEFRVEPKSVEITLRNNMLTITSWPGNGTQGVYANTPTSTHAYPVPFPATIQIARHDGRMNVTADGRLLAQLSSAESLQPGDIWFGLSADQPHDSWTLQKLEVSAPDADSLSIVNTQNTTSYSESNDQYLQVLTGHKRPGFLIGAAMALAPATADSQYGRTAFGGNFGSMTTENALKWQFIHPQPYIYDFSEADALVAIAQKNGMRIHGHTLVFGEANPEWVQNLPTVTDQDKAVVKQTMLDHIEHTVGHFKGEVASWDVVNEPLADTDESPVGLRQHVWSAAMGESYIAAAFSAAHRADPSAKLYINDFGLEAEGPRWTAMYNLVVKLKKAGVPIDGVGFESHVYEQGDEIDPDVLRTHIRALASVGLSSRISEMDVYSDSNGTTQAQQYADVLAACLSEPTCVSWTTWGVSDRYDLSLDDTDRIVYGRDFLWDKNLSPTPAVAALRQVLMRS